jgi:hypothetical protein
VPPWGPPQRRAAGFNFRPRCQPALLPAPDLPQDMPAQCLASARCRPRGPPPPPSSFPAPARIATGASAGRQPPPIHLFPMTLAAGSAWGRCQQGAEPACALWSGGPGGRPQPRTPPVHLGPSARGAHGVGAHAGRGLRLAQGPWPTTNEKGNGPRRYRSYLRPPWTGGGGGGGASCSLSTRSPQRPLRGPPP